MVLCGAMAGWPGKRSDVKVNLRQSGKYLADTWYGLEVTNKYHRCGLVETVEKGSRALGLRSSGLLGTRIGGANEEVRLFDGYGRCARYMTKGTFSYIRTV